MQSSCTRSVWELPREVKRLKLQTQNGDWGGSLEIIIKERVQLSPLKIWSLSQKPVSEDSAFNLVILSFYLCHHLSAALVLYTEVQVTVTSAGTGYSSGTWVLVSPLASCITMAPTSPS